MQAFDIQSRLELWPGQTGQLVHKCQLRLMAGAAHTQMMRTIIDFHLAPWGVDIDHFCEIFDEETAQLDGIPLLVNISVYRDGSCDYDFCAIDEMEKQAGGDDGDKRVVKVAQFRMMASWSFSPPNWAILEQHMGPYGVDIEKFTYDFDNRTFHFYPKILKVAVFIYNDGSYIYECTKPEWLDAPEISHFSGLTPGF